MVAFFDMSIGSLSGELLLFNEVFMSCDWRWAATSSWFRNGAYGGIRPWLAAANNDIWRLYSDGEYGPIWLLVIAVSVAVVGIVDGRRERFCGIKSCGDCWSFVDGWNISLDRFCAIGLNGGDFCSRGFNDMQTSPTCNRWHFKPKACIEPSGSHEAQPCPYTKNGCSIFASMSILNGTKE